MNESSRFTRGLPIAPLLLSRDVCTCTPLSVKTLFLVTLIKYTCSLNWILIFQLLDHFKIIYFFFLHFFPLSPTRPLPFLNLTDKTGSNGFTRGLPKSYCPPRHGYNADTDMLFFLLLLLLLYNGVNHRDITEILLKVAFNTITLPPIMVFK